MRIQSRIKRALRNERGAIMLEAMIVYMVTLFLLFMILAIFSVLYQRWNLQTIANESAARVAQTYRFTNIDDSSGEVARDDYVKIGPYRYLANVFTKRMETNAETRISDYSEWRLGRTTFTTDVSEPDVDVKIKSDAMGRRHVAVTITGEYAVPFGEALSYFGFDSTITYEVSAYADCVDIVDYIGFVDFFENQLGLGIFGSTTKGLVDSVIKLFDQTFQNE